MLFLQTNAGNMKYTAAFIFLLMTGGIAAAQNSTVAKDTVFQSNGNPVFRHKFTADPAAMVYKDK